MKRNKEFSLIIIILVWLGCFMTLMPLFYCGLFDYATGDDFVKGASAHQAFIAGGSFFDVLKAALESAHFVYLTHEGTWASNFILALQPAIWGERFYIITPFLGMLSLALGIGVTSLPKDICMTT